MPAPLHVRRQLRAAAATLLTGLSTTGANVKSGRVRPLPDGHPPTLLVYCIEEAASFDAQGDPPRLARELTLAVEGRVSRKGEEPPDDDLDQIALEVEARIGSKQTFGGLARSCELTRTAINVQAPGERYAGEVRLDYRVVYRTGEGVPGTAV